MQACDLAENLQIHWKENLKNFDLTFVRKQYLLHLYYLTISKGYSIVNIAQR